MIDLNILYNTDQESIIIDDTYELPKEYIVDDRIKSLSKIKVNGEISLVKDEDLEDKVYINAKIEGTMNIEDSITLKIIPYKFNIEYDDYVEEIYQNNQNKLDIFAFLWENIELEVPIRYTLEEND